MRLVLSVLIGSALATGLTLAAQAPEDHVALARTAAGTSYQNLFNFLCAAPAQRGAPLQTASGQGTPTASGRGNDLQGGSLPGGTPPVGAARGGGRGTPERSTWYVEPVKVFDNLYFLGQSEYSAWAVKTSDGIILIDTLFDYSVEDEVVNGLTKLGLDPATIKYAVVTHPHPDHHGGAKLLQERYKTRVLMSAADWDVIDRLTGTKPTRDMLATDGQTLTLGDTTITLYVTPGHTPGTLSVLMPVRDNGATHLAALWGGTGLNADRPSLEQYVASARRFSDIARKAGADVMLSNHTDWDGSKGYLPQLRARVPGTSNPYVVGTPSVMRFMTVAEECATARLVRSN
jgi:metallo-beta-lactamase class B